MIGQRLGPYEIRGRLGSGGMGEVFLGHDSRLGRAVAIKVLPPEADADSDRVERFRREARAISALSHPHICALYDIGQHDGQDFLVMERLEGQTLAERLSSGAMPLAQCLDVAIQIADGLAAAHRRGIIHRDLKPANVMLTPNGVKLLDFGLAKRQQQPAALEGGAPTQAMTAVGPLTGEGTLMGTFQYMAPEQFEGGQTDHRVDIFAFGAVLYEMLTGQRAFAGASPASLVGAIMHAEPAPLGERQPLSGPTLDRIVRKCLAKDPEQRWQTVADLRDELRWLADESLDRPAAQAPAIERPAWQAAGMWVLALGLALGLGGWWWQDRAGEDTDAEPLWVNIALPDGIREAGVPVLSPGGELLVFEADDEAGRRMLWQRHLGSSQARPILGTDGASQPFFSPDGRSVAYFAGGSLKRLDLDGGRIMRLYDGTSFGAAGSWSSSGQILFTPNIEGGLLRISATGGQVFAVTRPELEQGSFGHAWPHVLPDGHHFLFVQLAGESSGIHLGAFGEAGSTLLVPIDGVAVSGVNTGPNGQIVYYRDGDLYSQTLDLDRRRVSGEPFRIAEGVRSQGPGHVAFSVSGQGHLVFLEDAGWASWQLVWRDASGQELETVGPPGPYLDPRTPLSTPRLSPDGRWLAMARRDPKQEPGLWLLDMRRNNLLPFASRAYSSAPVWAPMRNELAFGKVFRGPPQLMRQALEGPAVERHVLVNVNGLAPERWPTDWSSSGRYLLYMQQEGDTGWDLHVVDLDAEPAESRPLTRMNASAQLGRISPDERWVAYVSNLTGRSEVYLAGFPDPGRHWQLSNGVGSAPFWSAAGDRVYFADRTGALMMVHVEVDIQGEPELSLPQMVHPGPGPAAFAVSDDGERFLALRKLADPPPKPYILVLGAVN